MLRRKYVPQPLCCGFDFSFSSPKVKIENICDDVVSLEKKLGGWILEALIESD